MLNTQTISTLGLFKNYIIFMSPLLCSCSKTFVTTSGKLRGISFTLQGQEQMAGVCGTGFATKTKKICSSQKKWVQIKHEI